MLIRTERALLGGEVARPGVNSFVSGWDAVVTSVLPVCYAAGFLLGPESAGNHCTVRL
jgi:hypothetical protein